MKTRNGLGHDAAYSKSDNQKPKRRPTEQDYLRSLNETVSLDDWQAIVRTAVEEAKVGHTQARAWLTQFMIGRNRPTLLDIQVESIVDQNDDGALLRAVAKFVERDDLQRLLKQRHMGKAKELVDAIASLNQTHEM